MARSLENKTNVQAPDSDYPFGRIKDNTGGNNGTPVNENVYGDFHQFFAKMFSEAGLTYNELPDNNYSGFQYYDALLEVIYNLINPDTWHSVGGAGEPAFQNSWANFSGILDNNTAQFIKDGTNTVYIRGAVFGGTASSTIFTLPVGYRPLKDTVIPRSAFEASAWVEGNILITKAGFVAFAGAANDTVYLDGISFKIT